MSNNKPKQKQNPKKREAWNSFAYLGGLMNRQERVILHLATNTLDDESQVEGVIIGSDKLALAFLTDRGRELLIFKQAIRFIEKVKGK